jgi:hypothetical protein
MTRPFQQWKVLPHGKLSEIDVNILTVTGEIRMPMMSLPRRMTVVRLNGSRLVVFSAIALNEDEMTKLEAYGRPAFLIVPSDAPLDAKPWKNRYPAMQVIAPEGARAKVEDVCRSTLSRLSSTTRTFSSSPFPEREGTRRRSSFARRTALTRWC